MLQLEILILKFLSIDTLSSRPIAHGEVSALYHEGFDHTVEARSLEVQWLALSILTDALLASAQRTEVLGRLGHNVIVKLEHDLAGFFSADGNVEEDLAACRWSHGLDWIE